MALSQGQISTAEPWVYLNIGGKKFTTTVGTINNEPESMLAAAVARWLPSPTTELFFDRDGERFQILLNWLRDGAIDDSHSPNIRKLLLSDAVFFGFKNIASEIEALSQLPQIIFRRRINDDFQAPYPAYPPAPGSLATFYFRRTDFHASPNGTSALLNWIIHLPSGTNATLYQVAPEVVSAPSASFGQIVDITLDGVNPDMVFRLTIHDDAFEILHH